MRWLAVSRKNYQVSDCLIVMKFPDPHAKSHTGLRMNNKVITYKESENKKTTTLVYISAVSGKDRRT